MTTIADGVVIAVDQGTGSTKAIAVDASGAVVGSADRRVGIDQPHPGHVEQDADEIAGSVDAVLLQLVERLDGRPIAAVGLSTQRESAVVWDRDTGKPLGPVLGWQDRRTRGRAEQLHSHQASREARERTGLPIDPMFSALKLGWLLDHIDPDRRACRAGEIAVGTVDSWLVSRLCGVHHIEAGNASRTQLLNLDRGDWDPVMLDLFGIPAATLPVVVASNMVATITSHDRLRGIPVSGVLGDSHAALFGHGIRTAGTVKATYGTGSSIMGLTDTAFAPPPAGTVRTIAWQLTDIAYAFEGNILATGATLVWLAGLLGCTPDELMAGAERAGNDATVDIVPAFAGLGAPWWDERAVAVMSGFDLGTDRDTVARAAAESIALQIEDVVAVFDTATTRCDRVVVDGGPAGNNWLMQLQADLSGRTVVRPPVQGLSALGAAHLAGATVGLFDVSAPLFDPAESTIFNPELALADREARHTRWRHAVARSRRPPPGEQV